MDQLERLSSDAGGLAALFLPDCRAAILRRKAGSRIDGKCAARFPRTRSDARCSPCGPDMAPRRPHLLRRFSCGDAAAFRRWRRAAAVGVSECQTLARPFARDPRMAGAVRRTGVIIETQ